MTRKTRNRHTKKRKIETLLLLVVQREKSKRNDTIKETGVRKGWNPWLMKRSNVCRVSPFVFFYHLAIMIKFDVYVYRD